MFQLEDFLGPNHGRDFPRPRFLRSRVPGCSVYAARRLLRSGLGGGIETDHGFSHVHTVTGVPWGEAPLLGEGPAATLAPCLEELPGAGLSTAGTCKQDSSGFSSPPMSIGTAAGGVDCPFDDAWLEATAIINIISSGYI